MRMHRHWRFVALLALATLASACVETNRPDEAACDAAEARIELSVSESSLTPADPAACRDQQVTLVITSTVDGLLHVHGYDEELPVIEVRDGGSTEVAFQATRSGEFPIELHTDDEVAGTALGVLTVHEP